MDNTDCWLLSDGTPLTMRPIEVTDSLALKALLEDLSSQDRHLRFHGAINVTSAWRLKHWTQVDPAQSLALVATASLRGHEVLVADARWVIDGTGCDAEVALLVAAAWRHRGIGARMLAALQQGAAGRGLRQLYGSVLASNRAMLALARGQGLRCSKDPDDRRLLRVSSDLRRSAAAPVRTASVAMPKHACVTPIGCADGL